MKKIVLLSCSKRKLKEESEAKDLYQGTIFKRSLKYANQLGPDKIFILSAEYGLLNLCDRIKPYEKTLNKMPVKERKVWAERVLEQLGAQTDINQDKFIFLVGERYMEFLTPYIKNFEVPMKGLDRAKKVRYLDEALK